jgi:CHAT domain-containing protein
MRYYFVLVFFFFLGHSMMCGQSDTALIRQQCEKAQLLNEAKDYRRAAELAQSTLRSLRLTPQYLKDLEVKLIHILGDCSLEKGDHTRALSFYETADSLLENAHLNNSPLYVMHLNKMGNYYREIQDFDGALNFLNRGLTLGRELLPADDITMANLYNNIGICYNKVGDFDQALEYYLQALSIRSRILPEGHPQIAQSYNNLGLCRLDKGQYPEALQAFEKAINTYYLYYGKDHQDMADVHLNIGNVYFELQDQRLFSEYQKALDIYNQTLGGRHPSVAICYNNLANAQSGQENYDAATAYYQKALDIMIHNYGTVHPDVAMSFYNTGISYYFAGQEQQARQMFEKCFSALNYQPQAKSTFDEVNNQQLLMQLFQSMAEMEVAAYYRTQTITQLENAFEYYRRIDQLLDHLRATYQAKGSKLFLMQTAHELYDAGIELALALFQLTSEEAYLFEAFQFSEKSKGILLLEALQKAEVEAFSGIPSEKTAEISQLEKSISELEKKRFWEWEKTNNQNKARIDTLSRQIFEQKQSLNRQISALESQYPQYYDLRYATSTLPVSLIQKDLLSDDQTIVEYFLGANSIQIFVLNKEDFQVISVNLDARFFEYLNAFNQTIRNYSTVSSREINRNLTTYAEAAHQLFQYLVAPVKDQLKPQLVIIPDSELGYLSFGALLSELPEDVTALNTHSYLIRDYAISYNYSVRLLKEMQNQKNKKRLKSYLGLAPHFLESNEKGLNQLKYNGGEITGVQKMLGGQVLFNEEATKANFLRWQSNYSVIHLATHGKANSTASDYSFLAFSETSESKGDEALLFVKEVYNLSTNAEMMVLSACETSAGKLQEGEGIASIARSFSYAGAKSLLATLWSVDDRATHDLVQLYFEQLKKGLPKDQAMQKAMLAFFDTHGKAKNHPYYWASFVLVGNIDALSFQTSTPLMLWGVPVLLLGLLLFFRIRRNFKTQD